MMDEVRVMRASASELTPASVGFSLEDLPVNGIRGGDTPVSITFS